MNDKQNSSVGIVRGTGETMLSILSGVFKVSMLLWTRGRRLSVFPEFQVTVLNEFDLSRLWWCVFPNNFKLRYSNFRVIFNIQNISRYSYTQYCRPITTTWFLSEPQFQHSEQQEPPPFDAEIWHKCNLSNRKVVLDVIKDLQERVCS